MGQFNGKGIETAYDTTIFRSRLEARWAYLFNGLGIPWEYEPFEMGGYIPDFVLLGDLPVLVEVKPATSFGQLSQYMGKTVQAATECEWGGDILVVGVSPIWLNPDTNFQTVGLMSEGSEGWEVDGAGGWTRCSCCGRHAIQHQDGYYGKRPYGCYTGGHCEEPDVWLIRQMWAEARNATRWMPTR